MTDIEALCARVERMMSLNHNAAERLRDEIVAALREQAGEIERLQKWENKRKGWNHYLVCNAGSVTPLGGDMCICIRLIQDERALLQARVRELTEEVLLHQQNVPGILAERDALRAENEGLRKQVEQMFEREALATEASGMREDKLRTALLGVKEEIHKHYGSGGTHWPGCEQHHLGCRIVLVVKKGEG